MSYPAPLSPCQKLVLKGCYLLAVCSAKGVHPQAWQAEAGHPRRHEWCAETRATHTAPRTALQREVNPTQSPVRRSCTLRPQSKLTAWSQCSHVPIIVRPITWKILIFLGSIVCNWHMPMFILLDEFVNSTACYRLDLMSWSCCGA